MKKYVKSLFIAIACVALVGLGYTATTVQAADPFSDVKPGPYSDWYYEIVNELEASSIVFGANYSNQFKPDQDANRGETAQFIANALNFDLDNVKDPGFTDVPKSHPHYAAIAALKEHGIINGATDTTFDPAGNLQRAHIAKILSNGFELEQTNKSQSKFADVNKYASYSTNPTEWVNYVETLVELDITKGKTSTEFAPAAPVTRAELAVFLKRTMDATDTSGEFEVIGVE